MNVIFKNVGQGDSIIVEWESKGENKIGIIDCNKVKKTNPVLDYIKQIGTSKIEFLIISHPHDDHYSGFKGLLDYIEVKRIEVNWFGHTFNNVGKEYWQHFELGYKATKDFDYILKKAIELKTSGLLKKWRSINEDWQLEIDENIRLHSLSPSHEEIQEYQRKVKLDSLLNKKEASSAANLLSTVFKLTKNDKSILLTSDAALSTFERIEKEGMIKDIEFNMIQAAHHGSIKNYHHQFWQNRNPKKEKKIAIISAGQNIKYQHPSLDTIKGIKENNFTVNCTSIVHGMSDYVNMIKKSLSLDMISDIEDDLVGGDKTFTI